MLKNNYLRLPAPLIFGLITFVWFHLNSCTRSESFPVGTKISSGAEHVNSEAKFFSPDDSLSVFNGGQTQSGLASFSGEYAALTVPKEAAFAFGYTIKDAGPDWYFKISVWRKSKNGKGALVAAAKDPKKFYLATSTAFETHTNGWEKLELEVYTPPTFQREMLSFYVWNNGPDTVFFDDFTIERLAKKKYPDYNEEPLVIVFDSSEYLKILEKRKEAFQSGILQTSDDDWVKAIIFADGDMMKSKVRLKGDWLDHLKGDKWSYRIKMRKGYSWNRMRTFSVQTPMARGFLNEWVAHKLFDFEDILTTRYGFIPLMINNESRGLYAWEEHFEKQLVESRNRREGPIIKFTEEAFWQTQKYSISIEESWPQMPYYQASAIKPFKQSGLVENEVLYNQFLNAQKLAQQYKNHQFPPGQIFDIELLAKYYAMLEITQARHGLAYHNQRFYFNPVLCKLEPIAFDGFSNDSRVDPGIENNYAYISLNSGDSLLPFEFLMANLFTDSLFTSKYLFFLKKFSNADYISKKLLEIENETIFYDSLINLEFPEIRFDFSRYPEVAADIRSYLPELEKEIKTKQQDPDFKLYPRRLVFTDSTVFEDTPKYFVNAYTEELNDDSVRISIRNYFPGDIIILGTGNGKYIDSFQHPEPKMKAYNGDLVDTTVIVSDTGSTYLFFMTPNGIESFATEILPWPYPEGLTPQQELMKKSNLENYTSFIIKSGNTLTVKAGIHVVDQPIIIPEGYLLKFEPGVVLDLVKSAMLITYSPIEMKGTEKQKIKITSSDFSANGFTVLQAGKRSKLDHVIFENLNTLNYKGWTLTGAVNFYESDVDITHTLFYRNQCEDALNTIRSDFKLESSSFENIYGDAFDSDFCTGLVSNSNFKNIGNDAIDFSGSQIRIADTEISEAGDKGISGGEDSYLTVENTTIRRSNIGLASKDLSTVIVNNSTIDDCNYGIVLLQKKAEYGPGKMVLTNTPINHAKTDYLIEVDSEVIEDGKLIKGDRENLAEIFY
jgi:hypothetical protein